MANLHLYQYAGLDHPLNGINMKTFFTVLILKALMIFTVPLHAASISTPAGNIAQNLGRAIANYQRDHDGKSPSKLSQLYGLYLDADKVQRVLNASLEERFILIDLSTVEMASPGENAIFNGGNILAVSVPISEDRRTEGNGRYIVWKTKEGSIRSDWLHEDVVKQQFEKAKVVLPSGPLQVQPPVLPLSPDYLIEKYGNEHFKDPKKPTEEELAEAKEYFAEKSNEVRPRGLVVDPIRGHRDYRRRLHGVFSGGR